MEFLSNFSTTLSLHLHVPLKIKKKKKKKTGWPQKFTILISPFPSQY